MYRSRIVPSALALIAAWVPGSAPAQCCGGHSKHGGATAAKVSPQPQAPAAEAGTKDSKLPADPVTGAPIDFAFKTVAADGPVYFANEAAVAKFKEDPQAYARKVNEQRAALAKLPRVQVTCPIMGNPIDGGTFAYLEGQGVYFCCPGCVPKYSADPAKYAARLAGSFTYQTRCPVDGETIDPTVYTDLPTGQRVYLFSQGEIEKFKKDPAQYAANLAAQGIGSAVPKAEDKTSARQAVRPVPARATPDLSAQKHSDLNHH